MALALARNGGVIQRQLPSREPNKFKIGCLGLQFSCGCDQLLSRADGEIAIGEGHSNSYPRALPAPHLGEASAREPLEGRSFIERCLYDGRILEAKRELDRRRSEGFAEEDADENGFVTPGSDIARVLRISKLYDRDAGRQRSLAAFGECSEGWVTDIVDDSLTISHQLKGAIFEIRCTTTSRRMDVATTVGAILEVDLQHYYRPNVLSATCFGESRAVDSAWHVVSRGRMTGGVEDVILQVSGVDALDEPEELGGRCVWVTLRTAGDEEVEEALERTASAELASAPKILHGCKVPPPDAGVTRLSYTVTTLRVEPLQKASQGVKLTMSIRAKPSRLALTLLGSMPGFVVRKLVRSRAKESLERFRNYAESCSELQDRMKTSPRTAFYEAIRRHTRSEAILPSVPGGVCSNSLSATRTTSGSLRKPDRWASSSWSEVMPLLPSNWADHAW